MEGRKKLKERFEFYKKEAERGYEGYHNPYDYQEEMEKLLELSDIEYNSEEWNDWIDKIHEVGMEFWDM
jgi:hypothetical protein